MENSGGKKSALIALIARLKRRRRLILAAKALGEAIGIFLAFVFAGILLSKLNAWTFDLRLYATLGGAAAGIGWLIFAGLMRKIRTTEVSIDADTHLGLKDRLTSAYLLGKSAVSDPLVDALMNDAEKQSETVAPTAVYPWSFPKSWRLSGAAALCTLAVFFVPYLGWLENPEREEERKRVMETGKKLIRLARETEERKNSVEFKPIERLQQDLESLGKKMELGKLDKGKALEELNKLQSEMEKAAKSLDSPEARKFMSDLSQKLMQQQESRKLGQALMDKRFEDLNAELRELKKRLDAGELSPEDLEMLEQLAEGLQEALERNPELGDAMDREAIENALEKLKENLEKERQVREQMKSTLEELKETTAQLRELMEGNKLDAKADELKEQVEKMIECFNETGTVPQNEIDKMRRLADEANKAMQQSASSSGTEKQLSEERKQEINELLDKLENECKEGGT